MSTEEGTISTSQGLTVIVGERVVNTSTIADSFFKAHLSPSLGTVACLPWNEVCESLTSTNFLPREKTSYT